MKAFTLTETIIAFFIIGLSVAILANLGFNYFILLNSIKERYLALNFVQEGLELALALRNKQIETYSIPWAGAANSGTYCLKFNTSTENIEIQQSNTPCSVFKDYRRLITYQDFQNQNNTNLNTANSIKVTSEVFWGRNNEIKLETIITKWHPIQP